MAMHPGEITGLNYLSNTQEIPFSSFPYNNNNFNMMQSTMQQAINLNGFFNNNLPSPPTYLSSNSTTSDESEELQTMQVIDERRQRRMISNRESARRSRMRKQRHLDELWSQVMRLRNDNNGLLDKLNNMSESHDKVVQENARLKEEASDLRQIITNMQMDSPYNNEFRDFDDMEQHIRPESSSNNNSITSSTDLLL